MEPICLTFRWFSRKKFSIKLILKKINRRQKSLKHFPGGKELRRSYLYFQIIQSLGIVCKTLTRHRLQFQSDFTEVAQPSKAFKPKVSGIYVRSVVSMITPLDSMVVVQVTLYYSTTETHEVIWAYNILGHMIPVKGRYHMEPHGRINMLFKE